MVQRRKATNRERSAAETRESLLRAGVELAQDSSPLELLASVKAADVARQAGRTIGAFYHHWPDQAAYRADLLRFVFDTAASRPGVGEPRDPDAIEGGAVRVGGGAELEETIRRRSRRSYQQIRTEPWQSLLHELRARHETPDIQALLRERYTDITEWIVPITRELLDSEGIVMRPPFTAEMLSVTLIALAEGLHLRETVDPDAVPTTMPTTDAAATATLPPGLDDGPWDLYSVLVLALLPSMTAPGERRDAELWLDHEDVRGLFRRLRTTWEIMVGRRSTEQPVPAHDRR